MTTCCGFTGRRLTAAESPDQDSTRRPKSPAFQFYPADFLADENVITMSLAERGAYITLMCLCWREGSIPSSIAKLARLCSTTQEDMESIWSNIRCCFAPGADDRLIHPRLEDERRKQEDFRKAKSDAGRNGAKRKHSGSTATHLPEQNLGVASILPEQKDGTATVLPEISHSKSLANSSSSSSSSSSSADIETTPEDEFKTGAAISHPPSIGYVGRVQFDEQWLEFVDEGEKYGWQYSPEEWEEAAKVWLSLGMPDRIAAFSGLRERKEAHDVSLTRAVPANYLRKRMWMRKVQRPLDEKPEPKPTPKYIPAWKIPGHPGV